MTNTGNEDVASEPLKLSRNEMRDKIFATKNTTLKSQTYWFNGIEVEFRQPSTVGFMEARDDGQNQLINLMIRNSYIPGTNDRVFEEADAETLSNMPMTKDMIEVIRIMNEVMDLKVEDKVKN
jgi:hypothetical protein